MTRDWNFDEVVDRSQTASMKWEPEVLSRVFGSGRDTLLPLWVADMDFNCHRSIRKAMEKRLAHQIYGYSLKDPAYLPAMISWYRRRHQWEINEQWVLTTPGVVPAVNYVIQRFSQPGDKVLIQTPVYYPFARSILNNGRQVADNPLKIEDGHFRMDFEDLAEKVKDPRVKLAILCSPHNPVGRVWTREELDIFGRICIENQVLVIADEIHCDLVMPGFKHVCFASISDAFAHHSITCLAASKTFNLAGLHQSSIIVPDPVLRRELHAQLENLGFVNADGGTLFGAVAAAAAYTEAEPWLEDLILYLHANFTYLKTFLETELPGVRVYDLQGTYLAWVDFNGLGLAEKDRIRILEEQAGVGLDHGEWFGDNGKGFERFNIACPRSILARAAEAIVAAFRKQVR
jgi:cystathionine beta-lyase